MRILYLVSHKMQNIRAKIQKKKDADSRERRKQIIQNGRVWQREPSIIAGIPSILINQDWDKFDEFLDSIGEKDIILAQGSVKQYVKNKYEECGRLILTSLSEWNDDKLLRKVNIMRLMNRLEMWEMEQIQQFLVLMRESSLKFSNNKSLQSAEQLLKLLKQIARYFQTKINSGKSLKDSIGLLNLRVLRQVISKSNLYQYCFSNKQILSFNKLLKNYRCYYAYLFSEKEFIDLLEYEGSLCELFTVVFDCMNQSDRFEELLALKIIKQVISIKNSEEKNAIKLMKFMEISIKEGYDTVYRQIQGRQIKTAFKSDLILQTIINLISNGELQVIILIIDIFAELFQFSDKIINAVFTFNSNKLNQQNEQDSLMKQQYGNYSQVFRMLMNHIFNQIRYKTYWLISNITGSEEWYFIYGLQFVEIFLERDSLTLESGQPHISNQINICLLNFMCNLRGEDELQKLTQIKLNSSKSMSDEKYENALILLIQILSKNLNHLYQVISASVSSQFQDKSFFMHRVLFAISNMLNICKLSQEKQKNGIIPLLTMQKYGMGTKISAIYQNFKLGTQDDSILLTLEGILQIIQKHDE